MVSSTSQAISGKQGVKVNIPCDKYVVLTGYVQSAAGQSVQVKDSRDQVVAEIDGKASIKPEMVESATFKSDGNDYTVYFFNKNNGHDSKVIFNDMNISDGTITYARTWTFLTEDSPRKSDLDFNDSTVQLTWSNYSG